MLLMNIQKFNQNMRVSKSGTVVVKESVEQLNLDNPSPNYLLRVLTFFMIYLIRRTKMCLNLVLTPFVLIGGYNRHTLLNKWLIVGEIQNWLPRPDIFLVTASQWSRRLGMADLIFLYVHPIFFWQHSMGLESFKIHFNWVNVIVNGFVPSIALSV